MYHFIIYVLCLSCFRICSVLPCGHLMGKGWPLGSLVCDFIVFLLWCLIVSIPDLCLLSYFYPLLLMYTQDLNPVIFFDTVAGEIQRYPNVKQIFKSRKDVHLNKLDQTHICNTA